MSMTYLNKYDEIYANDSKRFFELTKEVIKLSKVDLHHNYLPWNPIEYGPQIGFNDAIFTIDKVGNKHLLKGTGNNSVVITEKFIHCTYINFTDGELFNDNESFLDIRDKSIEETKKLIKKYFCDYNYYNIKLGGN